jgi:hypothetical protein
MNTPTNSNCRDRCPPHLLWFPLIAGFFFTASPVFSDVSLILPGAAWKYLDDGSNQGTAWRAAGFDDGAWASGASELGYGDGDEATVVSYGPNSSAKFITTYFRHTFSVADPAVFNSLALRLLRDDGAVVYLNGVEVRRDNMPAGSVSSSTLASTALGTPAESTFYETTLATSTLVAGTNVLAVEIHQANGTSSDVSFNLELVGVDTQTVTRGPYLQNGTPDSLIVRWRTNVATDSVVRYGSDPQNLNLTASSAAATTEHDVALTGMTPDTQYYYSVGTSTSTLAAGPEFNFFTAPPIGTAHPTRIWVLGDSGTADAVAAGVRDGYSNFTGLQYTDVWLMLGDNAYETGTDLEYQAAVFDMYPEFLRQTVLWSTIGNHDTAHSTNPPLTIPYFNIFNFPTNGEAGGVPSGTEKYYSFDYGRIHFVCLDSMTSSRAAGSPMLTWLQADLESTVQDWLIAFWHHPAYSRGSHNSDTETPLIEMRTNILPLLEAGGVDLVLAGHSHCYERSYLINGHYGLSTTFNNSMKLDGGSGREDGTGAYTKPGGLPANQGTVYAVAGNGGKVSAWTGGSTAEFNPSPHPAMFYSARHTGSMVLDVNGNRLDAKMIRENGSVDDYFTIVKNLPNQPPAVSITEPSDGAVFAAPAAITVTADASDSDGSVARVDFYAGSVLIGTATAPPFSVIWNNAAAGNYALTASATDNLGATTTSDPVNITVESPLPAAPSGLEATVVSSTQINLTWADNAGNESGYQIERSNNGKAFTQVGSTGPDVTNFANTGLTPNKKYFFRVRAFNAAGESDWSNTASAKTPR